MKTLEEAREHANKKTAVEWLVEELTRLGHNFKLYKKEVEEAKEMETEQRKIDTFYGYAQGYDDASAGKEPMRPELLDYKPDQYYNETFKNK